ncbi:MAG: response regulator [Rhodoferax sp.]
MTPHPRVLLVEDDAALRRFVAMALEDMPIELVVCAAVAPALEQLANGRFALILTDLMMPGESGFELLERLQREPRLRGDARVAVLSAGLTTVVREQLADLDIWRQLSKPVSVVTLVACVQDALDGAAAQAPGPPRLPCPPRRPTVTAPTRCGLTSKATRICSTPTAVPAWSSSRRTCRPAMPPPRRRTCRPCGASPIV